MWDFFLKKLSDRTDDLSFWEHAEVLRRYLIRCLLFVCAASVTAFFFKDFLFNTVICGPATQDFITLGQLCQLGRWMGTGALCFEGAELKLINIELAGQFRWHIIISVVAGFIVSFPFIIAQLWHFVKPALTPSEASKARGTAFYITLLFVAGVSFGYFIITPLTVIFLSSYNLSSQITNQITIGSLIGTVSLLPLSTGILFELPVMIYFLSRIGLLGPGFLKRNRKYAIIIILVTAGIITPSTDAFTQLLVSVPLYLLYEFSIRVSASAVRNDNPAG